jgi:hypothetical protein
MIKLESIQKQVKKQYPEAMLSVSPLGQYFIEWNDQNLNDIFLLEDCDTIQEAWNNALLTVRTERNMNRTHPLKKMMSEERKHQNKERIANRIHRNK